MRFLLVVLFLSPIFSIAQSESSYKSVTPVGAMFLTIPASPGSFSMGNLTSISTDQYAASFNNPGRAALAQGEKAALTNAYISYTPLATNISKNIKAINITGHQAMSNNSYLGINVQYFSLGETKFYDELAVESGSAMLQEYAAGVFYAKRFNSTLSMGLTAKVVVSSLNGGNQIGGPNTKPGIAVAVDYGLYGETESNIIYGFTLSNIGTKISYSNNSYTGYLPMNVKLGGGYKYRFNENSYLLTGLELSKPLFPSSPVYDNHGNIEKGQDTEKSIPSAIFSSFSDSPYGLSGEIQEFGVGTGAELCFNNQFLIRTGFFSQGIQISDGGYFTFGLGLIKNFPSNNLNIDLAYAVPSHRNLALRGNFKIGVGFSIFK